MVGPDDQLTRRYGVRQTQGLAHEVAEPRVRLKVRMDLFYTYCLICINQLGPRHVSARKRRRV